MIGDLAVSYWYMWLMYAPLNLIWLLCPSVICRRVRIRVRVRVLKLELELVLENLGFRIEVRDSAIVL